MVIDNGRAAGVASASNAAAAAAAAAGTAALNARDLQEFKPRYEYVWEKFYKYARGHLLNKFNVAMQGPYVEEALRVMDLNTAMDRNTKSPKTVNTFPFKHNAFKNWLDLHYDSNRHILNLFWTTDSVDIPSAKGEFVDSSIDTVKNTMPYPLLGKYVNGGTLKLSIVDDPYFMWYQFFNALFNVQFSPRVLKVRSTWQKILVTVDVMSEMTTDFRGNGVIGQRMTKAYTSTDCAQMFEFNSCVLEAAPTMKLQNSEDGELYKFDVSFKFPNAFQGTSKENLRGLRNNTVLNAAQSGTDSSVIVNGKMDSAFFEEKVPTRAENIASDNEAVTPNAISQSYYDKQFGTNTNMPRLMAPFSDLPKDLQTFPTNNPFENTKKSTKKTSNKPKQSKTPRDNEADKAAAYNAYNYQAYPDSKQSQAMVFRDAPTEPAYNVQTSGNSTPLVFR